MKNLKVNLQEIFHTRRSLEGRSAWKRKCIFKLLENLPLKNCFVFSVSFIENKKYLQM